MYRIQFQNIFGITFYTPAESWDLPLDTGGRMRFHASMGFFNSVWVCSPYSYLSKHQQEYTGSVFYSGKHTFC